MVDNEEIIRALDKCAPDHNRVVNLHIKINTGLNRYRVGSTGITKYPESHYDMVRCGTRLYV